MIDNLRTSAQAHSLIDLENACLKEMAENNCPFKGRLIMNGDLQRYSRDFEGNPDEWYVCYTGVSQKGNPYLICRYGTWSGEQENYTYKSYRSDSCFSQDEITAIRTKEAESRKFLEKEQEEDQEKRIKQAREFWDQAVEKPTLLAHSTYLNRKQVSGFGLRYGFNYNGIPVVIIPLCNIEGELQAIQCIQEDGTKRIYGPKKGNFHVIGIIEASSNIFISEGYATGATVHQDKGEPVVIAVDCGNLDAVLSNLRIKYPTHLITIAADDDKETAKNPGKTKAEAAASKYNCTVILPKFPEEFRLPGSISENNPSGTRPTDFNDLHVHFGMDEVRTQIQLIPYEETQKQDKQNNYQSNNFQFRSAYSLIQNPPKSNWLIKEYIDVGALIEIFGEPGCMKTFLALDMGLSIATGISYHGFPIKKIGIVFYIAGEGFHGIPKRLQAWSLANRIDLKDIPFFVSNQPAQFLDDACAKKVLLAIEELKAKHGEPTFVVIDTLNRNFGPGDESDNADMTKFIMAIDNSIRLRYNCSVLVLHHPPLNDPKRGRGASALHGALDWAYSLKKDGQVIVLSNTKVKDHEPPSDIYFECEVISLPGWIDGEDNQTMTSCVLKRINSNVTQKSDGKSRLTPSQKIAYDCLLKLCEVDGSVFIDDWRNAAYQASISLSPKQDAKKKAFQRAVETLTAKKLVEVHNNYWKPCGTRDMDETLAGHVSD